jgi:hypothetical protein
MNSTSDVQRIQRIWAFSQDPSNFAFMYTCLQCPSKGGGFFTRVLGKCHYALYALYIKG